MGFDTEVATLMDSTMTDMPVDATDCRWFDVGRPRVVSPLQRGVARWAREQARQAAEDPGREWYGAMDEFYQLKLGNHPDPDPAALIMPENRALYGRLRLNGQLFRVDENDLRFADLHSLRLATRPVNGSGERSPYDPQRVAAECRDLLDELIAIQDSKLEDQVYYDAKHPDEVPEVEVYSSLNKTNVETSLDYQI